MTYDDWAISLANKIRDRHVPQSARAVHKICRCCRQRSGGEPIWPCDARKLATAILIEPMDPVQRQRIDDLLDHVEKNLGPDHGNHPGGGDE